MEEVCEICGVVGLANMLLTCTQCKLSRTHVYCLRVPLDEPIDDWCCEECESKSVQEALTSNQKRELPVVPKLVNSNKSHAKTSKLPSVSKKGYFGREKRVAEGKTQYLPVRDALKLSSRDNKSRIQSKLMRSKSSRSMVGVCIYEKTPIRRANSPPRKDLGLGSAPSLTTQIHGSMGRSEGQSQQFRKPTEVQRPLCNSQPSQAPMDKHMQKEHPTKFLLPHTNLKSSSKQSSSASPRKAPPFTISSGGGHSTVKPKSTNCDAKNTRNDRLSYLEKSRRIPALGASWRSVDYIFPVGPIGLERLALRK